MSDLERTLRLQAERLKKLDLQTKRDRIYRKRTEAELKNLRASLLAAKPAQEKDSYSRLIRRIRAVVRKELPRSATVIVISKGDPALLKIGRTAWHFPRAADGQYAGYHPTCSTAAIAHLEALRARGGQYLLLPSSAFWWLEHYGGFRHHIEERYRLVAHCEDVCLIYSLCEPPEEDSKTTSLQLRQMVAEFQRRFERDPAILDWNSGIDFARMFPQLGVFVPQNGDDSLPYLDRSFDIVATRSAGRVVAREAHRVATAAVVTTREKNGLNGTEPELAISWLGGSPPCHLPSASIILPCYTSSAVMNSCLRSLVGTLWTDFDGEIIVVHDAANAGTRSKLKEWTGTDSRVKAVRTYGNPGFIDACNSGARAATGKILVFISSTLILLPDWLPPLLRTFRDFPDAGVVGGKLLFPDGTLQEAGGIVFRDGSVMHFGRGDFYVEGPLYSFVREVDRCSASLLATRRTLFNHSGGFDREYHGCYDDTDYCFKARKRGYHVYCQPEVAAVHRYGSPASPDSFSATRRQAPNQLRFKKQWQGTLQHQPICPNKLDQPALQALAVRANAGGN
jgi:GT2 family glycosyltransferase